MSEYKYVAFISYQRADEEWAKWFHHQLEHYHLPADIADRPEILQQEEPPITELRPMFLDEEELAGGNLADSIRIALNDSRFLIVLCSPNSAKSEWVDQEVKTFIDDGRINNIIPVIIDGVPYSKDPDTECFVPSLRGLKRTDKELLGINVRAGREMASVKVVSQLLGVSFDSLWNRYEREKEQERIRLIEEKRRLQRLESRYLSEKGLDAIDAGNSTLARRIALEALPVDIHDPEDRPFVGEAADMLIRAYKYNNTIYSEKSQPVRWAGFGVKGNLFATCSFRNKGIQLWDPASGLPVKHIPCDSSFGSLCISSDGNVIAGAGYHAIYVFNLEDDTVKSIPIDEEEFMMTFQPKVTLSPCGRYVACISNDEENSHIVLFDMETCKDIRRFVGHTDRINCVAFHPQGQCMISGSSDQTIRIWNIETGKCLDVLEIKSAVRSVCYNPDGTKLLAALAAKVILLWHIGSGEKPKVFGGHTAQVSAVFFNSDETKLISTSNDNTVRLWDMETGESEVIVSHNNRVSNASLSSDNRYLVSIDDSVMRITDFKGNDSNKIISRSLDVCVENPHFVFSPDSRYIYYSSNYRRPTDDIEFFKWDLQADTSVKFTIKASGPAQYQSQRKDFMRTKEISRLYPLDSSRVLVSVNNDGVYLYDTDNDVLIKKLDCLEALWGDIVAGATPSEIVIQERGSDLIILNLDTLEITRLFNLYDMFMTTVHVFSDRAGNLYMMKGDSLEQVYVYNIVERKWGKTFTLPHCDSLTRLEFSKDQSRILVINSNSIKIWDMASEKYVLDLIDDEKRCRSARFSPDDDYVITACGNEVKLWDLKTAQCFQTIQYDAMVAKATISPDGTRLAFSSADRKVQVQSVIPMKSLIEQTRATYAENGLSEAERKALHLEL